MKAPGTVPNTHQDDSSFSCGKLEKDPLVHVGSPDSQSVTSLQAQSQQTCSHLVNLHTSRGARGPHRDTSTADRGTHVLLEVREGFADAVLHADHRLPVGPALHRGVQPLAHRLVQQRGGGGAVHVAGGERGFRGRTVHVDGAGGILDIMKLL